MRQRSMVKEAIQPQQSAPRNRPKGCENSEGVAKLVFLVARETDKQR
jgi:hypothetical protein